MAAFTFPILHLFDKKGDEYIINYTSSIKFVIDGDYEENAVFHGIVNQTGDFERFMRISGGKFSSSETTRTAKVYTNSGTQSVTVNVSYDPIQVFDGNLQVTHYTATDISVGANHCIDINDMKFPSMVFNGIMPFERVSTGLIETNALFLFGEKNDLSKTIDTLGEVLDASWQDNYELLFFIDNRSQQDFRFFMVNHVNDGQDEWNDEVVWSDRVILASEITNDDPYYVMNVNTTSSINIGFSGALDGVYEETLYVCLIDKTQKTSNDGDRGEVIPIGTFAMKAEAIGEDERYRTLFENFGIPDPIYYDNVYRDTVKRDDLPDYVSINRHSKEMFLAYNEIFPYVGTYKALINAVDLLGYDDIFFKEWYKETGISPDTHNGYIAFDMQYKTNKYSHVISQIPISERIRLKKLNWISMMYRINMEVFDKTTDKFGFPDVVDTYTYYNDEMFVKLISLREWLEKYVMGLNCRIIDIGGEGIYFERYKQSAYGGTQMHLEYDNTANICPIIVDDNNVLRDGSADITVQMDIDKAKMSFVDYGSETFANICQGYIDGSIYYSKSESCQDSDNRIFISDTFGGYGNSLKYKINASSRCDNFLFGPDYISEASPEVFIRNGKVMFNPHTLLMHEKNTAFTKLPVIILEKAVLKIVQNSWDKDIKYVIYQDKNSENRVSYVIKDMETGETHMSEDYIILVPPTFSDGGDHTNITPYKSQTSVSYPKKKSYGTDITTYGLRYSANNPFGIPLFSIAGYSIKNIDMNIPANQELYLDILDGKMLFVDNNLDRNIYLNFTLNANNDKDVAVNITYTSDEFNICQYMTYNGNPFTHFANGYDYSEFVTNYLTDVDSAIIVNNQVKMRVNNIGDFYVDGIGIDYHNNIFAAHADRQACVYMSEPHLTTMINEPESNNAYDMKGEKLSDDEVTELIASYNDFCIFEYMPRAIFPETDDISKTQYNAYPYNTGLNLDATHAHFMNLCDKFRVITADDEYYDIESNTGENDLLRGYQFVVHREGALPNMKIPEMGDSTDIESSIFASRNFTGCNITVFNELGNFPIMQLPGNIKNAAMTIENGNSDYYIINVDHDITNFYIYNVSTGEDFMWERDMILTRDIDGPVYVKDEEHGIDTPWAYGGPNDTSILFDMLEEYISKPYISLYIHPSWQEKVHVIGVEPDKNRVYVQSTDAKFFYRFKPGEMVKLIHTVKDHPEYMAQASYKVIGYDAVGLVLILEGEISNAYNSTENKKYAYADIPFADGQFAIDETLFNIEPYGFEPQEYEDEPWITGWLVKRNSEDEPWSANVTYHALAGTEHEHTHTFKIPAGFYVTPLGVKTIRYRVYTHDDDNCLDGKYEHAIFAPWYAKWGNEFDSDLFISYAHNIFTDYSMPVTRMEFNPPAQITVNTQKSEINSKMLKFVDDTFTVDLRDYDFHNGITGWMNHDASGIPAICEQDVYRYHRPVILDKKGVNAAFSIDFEHFNISEENSNVMWKLYKSMDGKNNKTCLFESWNKVLFVDNIEHGIYDVQANVYDKYGNVATRLFEGAIKNEYTEPQHTEKYTVTLESVSVYENDTSYGIVTGAGEYGFEKLCTIKAVPQTGHTFIGWFDKDDVQISQKPVYAFYPDRDTSFTAKFEPLRYTVTASVLNSSTDESSTYGSVYMSEGTASETEFYYGTLCTVTAVPNYYPDSSITYKFDGWHFINDKDSSVISNEYAYAFYVYENTDLYAQFERRMFAVMATSNNRTLGIVTGAGLYEALTPVDVVGIDGEDARFIHWLENDEIVFTSNTFEISSIDRDYHLLGVFETTIPQDLYTRITCYLENDISDEPWTYFNFAINDTPIYSADDSYDSSYNAYISCICVPSAMDPSVDPSSNQVPYFDFKSWRYMVNGSYIDMSESSFGMYVQNVNNNLSAIFKMNKITVDASIFDNAHNEYGNIDFPQNVHYGDSVELSVTLGKYYKIDHMVLNERDIPAYEFAETSQNDRYTYTIVQATEDIFATVYIKVKDEFLAFYISPSDYDVSIGINMDHSTTHEFPKTFDYSTDCLTWSNWQSNTVLEIPANTRLYIKADTDNKLCTNGLEARVFEIKGTDGNPVNYSAAGNIMSLLISQFPADYDVIPLTTENYDDTNNTRKVGAFSALFKDDTNLIDVSALIMPINAMNFMGYRMFRNTSITSSPKLRAKFGDENPEMCYREMFYGCMHINEIFVSFERWTDPTSVGNYRTNYTLDWLNMGTNHYENRGGGDKHFHKCSDLETYLHSRDGIPNDWDIINDQQ